MIDSYDVVLAVSIVGGVYLYVNAFRFSTRIPEGLWLILGCLV